MTEAAMVEAGTSVARAAEKAVVMAVEARAAVTMGEAPGVGWRVAAVETVLAVDWSPRPRMTSPGHGTRVTTPAGTVEGGPLGVPMDHPRAVREQSIAIKPPHTASASPVRSTQSSEPPINWV